ncbi:MAG: recombination mediator RecR [Candidatus Omnitrophota bacterium]
MSNYPDSIERLIAKLVKLPGIGKRGAERIVFYLLNSPKDQAEGLASSITEAKAKTRLCKVCNNLSEQDTCKICQDQGRDRSLLCVVEEPKNVISIENSSSFKGLYHVLLGSIAPLEGRGPGDLAIEGLLSRLKQNNVKEVIIATDADTEGETTALYLSKVIKPYGVKLTRIGVGIPLGANLEYIDSPTLSKALESRRDF